ncbi:Alpha/Beta hydrolase protein [Xylariaceae sp. FL1019]|nr:Alpha/Beta hydrolase protein [Xylariaceae sp. FL1019]
MADIYLVDSTSFPNVLEQNVTVTLKDGRDIIRCNVYRPQDSDPVPVLVTYGPYGKDVSYKDFHPKSFSEVNPRHQFVHSAWETPDPKFWTSHGYAIVRADERGSGQSPGLLDTMSRATTEAFCDLIEWASDQPWSTGKIGLLGVSYYAGSQWRVAARKPKGLCAMIPWEGMSDYYRDRCRHGGILSNGFIKFRWDRQIVTSQYGRPGRKASNWGPDTVEGDLTDSELLVNRQGQTQDNQQNRYRDDIYYASKDYDINIKGYYHAASKFKYLRMITGRHDLPFYYEEEVDVQLSFLDAFLKGDDRVGWSKEGKVAPISLVLRKGDLGFNNPEIEKEYIRREEREWPIARTQYTKFYLTPLFGLDRGAPSSEQAKFKLSYRALGALEHPQLIHFTTEPFAEEVEVTRHVTAHLHVSVSPDPNGPTPSDIDLFVTTGHIGPSGKEVLYTGTAGDPVPLTKSWLRVSLRKINHESPKHRKWLPRREYTSRDVLPVIQGDVYPVDVEVWPTNVIIEQGGKLIFEVSSGDTQGSGIFTHDDPVDRAPEVFQGTNHICFGPNLFNYVTLPIIPGK